MTSGVAVVLWVLLGVLCLALYLGLRQKEVRAAWARRAEGAWSWKLLIPRSENPSAAWIIFGTQGVLAALWFLNGTLWLAVPSAALCLICLMQALWGQPPEDASPR